MLKIYVVDKHQGFKLSQTTSIRLNIRPATLKIC